MACCQPGDAKGHLSCHEVRQSLRRWSLFRRLHSGILRAGRGKLPPMSMCGLRDLYYCHRVDGKTPIEQTMHALAGLKAEGKIKYIGLSEVSAATLRRACKIGHVAALQVEYSLWSLDIENPQVGILQTCRELGVATIAYSPIGRGMLSGLIRSIDDADENDRRRNYPRFTPENFSKNLVLVDQIVGYAKKKGVTATQLVLAWLLAQGPDIVPIPGTTKLQRLQENLEALKIALSEEEVREIRVIAKTAEVQGSRYPEMFMKQTFGNTPEEQQKRQGCMSALCRAADSDSCQF
ncbi:hypothetical protein, variant [Verruconis gallopava]|uniref:NADP-dependent oxidoreductase domain-containing protein n=1 Tax=Verruconis gallopava TaxID=253628 RepID=A0A0D1Y0A7_9PEZI|nr:hypothetical protein, variant [Verruconis gallopava]KIW08471.1 hypothetical protein, variant [Verruconis gallopava]